MTSRLSAFYDVVICGASIAGCATAQALVDADPSGRRSVLLFDLHRDVSPRFSGEMLHPTGVDVLDELGFLDPLLADGAVHVEGFAVSETADADPVRLDYRDVPGSRPHGLGVHHKTLVRRMRDRVRDSRVDVRGGLRLVELLRDGEAVRGVVVRDAEGQTHSIRADVVVGADGKASSTRRLAGIPDHRETLGFTGGVEVVDPQLPSPLHANVVLGAPGPMLCYPIERRDDGLLTSRVTFDLPHRLPAKGPGLVQYLLDAFVPYLPEELAGQVAAALVERVRSGGKLEMAPTVNLPAPPAVLPGLALVGDAGGCSHPITASGMTMGLLDARTMGQVARTRRGAAAEGPWLDAASLRQYRSAHDRYVPTRQALADAIYEAFRGEGDGARAIRRALFSYWRESPQNRQRSLALLACAEGRPRVFLAEYLRTARHAVEASLTPAHATHLPVEDRLRQVQSTMGLAGAKFGLVAQVAWAQLRPSWLSSLGA